MSVIEHVELPISDRPKPNGAIEPSDQKDNAIAPHWRGEFLFLGNAADPASAS
jgi:hypothetical protein